MTDAIIDSKKLYELNQFVKNNPYYYDLVDHHFISHDGQSDILISSSTFKIEGAPTKNRYIFIEDGKALFKFLGEHKKGKEVDVAENVKAPKRVVSDMFLTKNGFECDMDVFPVSFSNTVDLPLISNENTAKLNNIDCKKSKLFYENDLLIERGVNMTDILEIIVNKKKLVQNMFVFMELIGNDIHLYESKLGLTLKNKTLICLDNFSALKTKKNDKEEYLHFHIGKSRLYVSYGNSEYDFIYKFYLHDLH